MYVVKSVSVAAADMRSPVAQPERVAISLSAFEEVFANARPLEGWPGKVVLRAGFERTSVLRKYIMNSPICFVNRSIDDLSLSCFGKSTYSAILRMRSGLAEKLKYQSAGTMSSQQSPRRRRH